MKRIQAVATIVLLLIIGFALRSMWSFNTRMLPSSQADEANANRIFLTSLIVLPGLGVCVMRLLYSQTTKCVMKKYETKEATNEVGTLKKHL